MKLDALNLSVTWPGSGPGYYAFVIYAPQDVGALGTYYNIGLTMTMEYYRNVGTPQLTTYAHRAIPNIGSNLQDLTELRITAASGMITNKAAMLQLGGQVAAVAMPEGVDWFGFDYDRINGAASAWSSTAALGVHGYIKPSISKDWDTINEWIPVDGNSIGLAGLPQLSDAAFIIPVERSAQAETFLYPAGTSNQAAYFTSAHAIEFETTNQLFAKAYSKFRREELALMRDLLGALPQFHHNATHEKNIFEEVWSGIKGAAKAIADGVVTYGPMVMDAAKFILPLLAL